MHLASDEGASLHLNAFLPTTAPTARGTPAKMSVTTMTSSRASSILH